MSAIDKSRMKRLVTLSFVYVFLSFFALIYIYPLVWIVFNSLKGSAGEIFSNPWTPPVNPTLENYIKAWQIANFGRLYINSIIVTSATITILVLLVSLAGYGFSRFRFRGRDALFLIFVSGYMVPSASLVIPLYFMMKSFGLLNNLLGLILAYVGLNIPLPLFIIRSFYNSIPVNLEEAAIIDGASPFTVFWEIVFPLLRPGIASIGIWIALNTWNEFLYALTFLSSPGTFTVPIGLLSFFGLYANAWGLILAGFVIVLAPLEIIYILFQKQIVRGLTRGAIRA
ncbi:MAG: carbohydrate ABC transporter permease [Thermoproteota archaeon]